MSLDGGVTFCVVCGRFDRELVQRKSGLKCTDCVGRRSKKDYAVLQQQQATFMLLSMNSSVGGIPSVGGRQQLSPRVDASNGSGISGVSPGSSHHSQVGSPGSPRPLPENDTQAPLPLNPSERVRVPLDEVVVTVERPTTILVDVDKLTVPLVGKSIKTQQSVTVYEFVTRRKHCPHETKPTTLPGSQMGTFSLMCPDCSRPLTSRRHRYSHILRVFEQLKSLGGDQLPELPPKRVFSRFNTEFIMQRRHALEDFVAACVGNSFLVRHPQLLDLLGLEEDRHAFDEPHAPAASEGFAGSAAMPPELDPKVLAGWKRGALIGKGSFGAVYLGLLSTSQLVAVKVVRVAVVDEAELDDLQGELAMLRELYHPNIVPLLGALRDDGKQSEREPSSPTARGKSKGNSSSSSAEPELCIFTEYVECGSIARMVRKFGALPFPVIQRYLRQVLLGLSYLHEKDVVHRDIKGDNILVAKDGTVKLADFGCSAQLARLAEQQSGDAATGGMAANLAGTPLWMSPEAMRGEQLTTATDVWSLGCVGIEVLGRPPWKMSATENVFTAMFRFQKSPNPPDGFPTEEEAPASYRDFLSCCLQRVPEDRPTAQQLLMHPFFSDELVVPVENPEDDLMSEAAGSPQLRPSSARRESSAAAVPSAAGMSPLASPRVDPSSAPDNIL